MKERITGVIRHSVVQNMSALALIQVGNLLLPLIIIPYISRIIGVEKYGDLEYARILVAYFTVLIDYGFNYTATREVSLHRDNPDKINEIISKTFAAKFILLILSTLIFAWIIYMEEDLVELSGLLWATFIFNIGQFLFPIWFFQGIEKMAFVSISNFVLKLIILLLVVLIITNSNQYWLYNLFISLGHILFGVFSVFLLRWKYKIQLISFKFIELFQLYKSGFNVFFSTLLVTVYVTYGFILLKKYGTEVEVGAYSTASKLVVMVRVLILAPFAQAFFPHITKMASENIIEYQKLLKKASLYLLVIMLCISIFTWVNADWIILMVFGKGFSSAVVILKVLCFLPIFSALNNVFSYQGLLSLKKDRIFLILHIVSALIVIIASHIIVPSYGTIGLAYLNVILEGLLMSAALFFLVKSIKYGS